MLRKFYLTAPTRAVQQKIVEIRSYELYEDMTPEEVESAVEQIGVTNRLSQIVLNEGATKFLVEGNNTLTEGVPLPFPTGFPGSLQSTESSFSYPLSVFSPLAQGRAMGQLYNARCILSISRVKFTITVS